jgi:hypothetical protein
MTFGKKSFLEVDMVEWLCASLTDEVSIPKSHVNRLTNHMFFLNEMKA